MHGPPFLGWLMVAICTLTATVCLARAAHARQAGQTWEASALEALMGLGMAAMAVPGGPLPLWALLTVFALSALWSARLLLRRDRHQIHHLTEAGAMIYMTLAMAQLSSAAGGHAGHGSQIGGVPLVTGVLTLYFTLYALRTAGRLAPVLAGPAQTGVTALPAASGSWRSAPVVNGPEVGTACRVTLAMGMAAMLVTL